jgi:hypothetical protein
MFIAIGESYLLNMMGIRIVVTPKPDIEYFSNTYAVEIKIDLYIKNIVRVLHTSSKYG